ncbi:MAG: hypothetical protein IH621_01055 [Krumholzibacteria bacterium]|nr:hypothetical protein [Candidatus Krumholzibacteria bacterium]
MKPFVAFDMGNVLLPFDHMRACRSLGEVVGMPAGAVYSLLFDSGLARQYELGTISSSSFVAACQRVLGQQLDAKYLRTAWSDIFTEDEQMRDLVASLSNRADLCLVSNTNDFHFQWVSEHFPVISAFPRLVLSHEIHSMKPDFAIYSAAARYVSHGQLAVYIDDVPAYASASEAHGFRGLCFTGFERLVLDLEALSVL